MRGPQRFMQRLRIGRHKMSAITGKPGVPRVTKYADARSPPGILHMIGSKIPRNGTPNLLCAISTSPTALHQLIFLIVYYAQNNRWRSSISSAKSCGFRTPGLITIRGDCDGHTMRRRLQIMNIKIVKIRGPLVILSEIINTAAEYHTLKKPLDF